MKIVCYCADQGGCAWYRLILPYNSMPEHEVRFRKAVVTPDLYWADVAVFQRVDNDAVISRMREMKSIGKRVILDLDDLLRDLPASNPVSSVYGQGKPASERFEQALRIADVFIASTQGLADAYRDVRDAVVCENFISDEHLRLVAPPVIDGKPKRPGEIRIGYVGSPTHAGDVSHISQALVAVAKEHPEVRFVFFGQPSTLPSSMKERTEFHECIGAEPGESASDFMLRYYLAIKSLDLDIAVAPLKGNPFNACKSFVKMLELGVCGVPIVASDFGPYRDYRERGGQVVLAPTHEWWVNELKSLVESPEKRADFAIANIAHIMKHHTTAVGVASWEALLASMVRPCVRA